MMNSDPTLSDFINAKWRALTEAEARIKGELRKIADERTQLERAASAAGISLLDEPKAEVRDFFAGVSGNATSGDEQNHSHSRRRRGRMSMKEAVLEVLREAGHGLSALEILPLMNQKIGVEYERTSLSPQLTRLKEDGEIERDGVIWTLVDKGVSQTDPAT